jgi:hypothetical protein
MVYSHLVVGAVAVGDGHWQDGLYVGAVVVEAQLGGGQVA